MDLNTETGKDIPIEMRNGEEIRSLWYQKPMVPAAAKTLNPAFDITPHELVTAFITEKAFYNRKISKPFKRQERNPAV